MTSINERVLLELVMAKPWKRLLAWLIDQAFLSALVLFPIFLLLAEPYPYVLISEVLLLMSLLYFTLMEGAFGRSIGKLAVGITVYSENGRRVGFSRAMLRRIGMITPILLFLDAAVILATSRKQRLFDVIASTVVVEGARVPEAVAYLRGADVDKLLARCGITSRAPVEEKRNLARALKKMEEMQAKLKALRARGELTRGEYARLKEKYEVRVKELKERLRES
ncbi:MAG: hypothetical protein AVW06_02775 [Hadesarchaea archaeon DG-33-1]|nr:MAG: hypothetical protein AVW06_02775 [Hadesarchaea archaeon DG-33-1]